MDSDYAHLAETILSKAQAHHKPRFLVAIAGAPGSRKTNIAKAIQKHSNAFLGGTGTTPGHAPVTLVSMDGFHLPRCQFDKLPNREQAYRRRGAPWFFDSDAFLDFVRRLCEWADMNMCTELIEDAAVIYAPSFDHQMKDPVENGIVIHLNTSIIILEGNYLLFDRNPRCEVAGLVDLRIFIEVALEVARERLARRHVGAGIEDTMEGSYARVDGNDYLNGMEVCQRLAGADIAMQSC